MELDDIKKLRTKAGLTQAELARRAGVTQAHIAKIESGKVDHRFSTVERIFKCLRQEEIDMCGDHMSPQIYGVDISDSIAQAGMMMRGREISQVMVFDGPKIVGMVTEDDLLRHKGNIVHSVQTIMGDPPPSVSRQASVDTVKELLLDFPAVVVMERETPVGIITKSDLIRRT